MTMPTIFDLYPGLKEILDRVYIGKSAGGLITVEGFATQGGILFVKKVSIDPSLYKKKDMKIVVEELIVHAINDAQNELTKAYSEIINEQKKTMQGSSLDDFINNISGPPKDDKGNIN